MSNGVATSIKGLTLGRIVAFASPAIATLSGSAATWLTVHAHFLSLFHVTHNSVASAIAQVGVFAVTAVGTYVLHHKWLDGWSKWERNVTTGS